MRCVSFYSGQHSEEKHEESGEQTNKGTSKRQDGDADKEN
jgi:hypothetical protein